jgi:RNA exonuclease 1
MTVTRIYEQFLRIYESLADHSLLAFRHSELQERKIHEISINQAGYKQTAAGVLGRLKKRLPASDDTDVGIDGEWIDKQHQIKKVGIRSNLQQYILTEEQLAEMNYPMPSAVDIPQSVESSVGMERQCDRCNKPFIVKDILTKQDMELCRYHHGRIRKVKVHGKISLILCHCGKLRQF